MTVTLLLDINGATVGAITQWGDSHKLLVTANLYKTHTTRQTQELRATLLPASQTC